MPQPLRRAQGLGQSQVHVRPDAHLLTGLRLRVTNRKGSTLKPFYAVAALTVWVSTNAIGAKADDAAASSGPSCEVGDPLNTVRLSPAQLAASGALFMKLCMESSGALVNGDDSRLVHSLTQPGKYSGHGPQDFYPATAIRLGQEGRIFVAFVVEIDGRTSSATVIKSSGYPRLDDAALQWIRNVTYESPAYLDFTPARMYKVMYVDFKLR